MTLGRGGTRRSRSAISFETLIETLKDQEDYGAYESVHGAIARFDAERRGRLIAAGNGPLLERSRDLAGNVLSDLAFSEDAAVASFNGHVAPAEREALARFIAEEEDGGWLDHADKRGRLRV